MKDLKVTFGVAEPQLAQFAFTFVRAEGEYSKTIAGTVTFDLMCSAPVIWNLRNYNRFIQHEESTILATIGVTYGQKLAKEREQAAKRKERDRKRYKEKKARDRQFKDRLTSKAVQRTEVPNGASTGQTTADQSHSGVQHQTS